MWKLISAFHVLSKRSCKHTTNIISIGKRYFLSEAFKCEDAWQKRFQAPVIQNVNLDELFYVLDQKFNNDGKASAIDIDLFANAVRNDSYVDELEDLIHKLRLSSNTTKTLPSTPHAVIRYFIDIEQYDTLLKILDDRLNYGVFADNYCLTLLLDTFIKKKKISEAARLSSIHMLQEDWSCPLVSALSLYSCYLYVLNPTPWQDERVEEDSGEVIKVRVGFVRNPYFDDHFDLRDPQLLVGKTLATIGMTMPDTVGQTFHLIGLGLYKKWDKVISFLKKLLITNVKPGVFQSGVKILEETIEKDLNDENDPESKLRGVLKELLKELDNHGLVTTDDLGAAVVSKVENTVLKEQQNLIDSQQAIYLQWENERERLLQEQIEELRRQQRIAAIEEEKQKLIEKEKELFFFDNEEKIDLILEKYEQTKIESEAKSKKAAKLEEIQYVPPEITRKKA